MAIEVAALEVNLNGHGCVIEREDDIKVKKTFFG
jgi:hypothetical protein